MSGGADRRGTQPVIVGSDEIKTSVDPRAALYRKLGVHRRTEALVWGRENGFPLGGSGG